MKRMIDDWVDRACVDVVDARPRRNDDERLSRPTAATAMHVALSSRHAGDAAASLPRTPHRILPRRSGSVAISNEALHDRGHLMVVPTVRVVVGDDDRGFASIPAAAAES